MTDVEIKAHLTEVAGFTPCDGWAHIIDQLRKGKTYYVNRTNGKLKIKVIGNEIQTTTRRRS